MPIKLKSAQSRLALLNHYEITGNFEDYAKARQPYLEMAERYVKDAKLLVGANDILPMMTREEFYGRNALKSLQVIKTLRSLTTLHSIMSITGRSDSARMIALLLKRGGV